MHWSSQMAETELGMKKEKKKKVFLILTKE